MRLLMVTDQAFWQCSGGAHQRIRCLWAGLQQVLSARQNTVEAAVFFLGPPAALPAPSSSNLESIGQIISPQSPSTNPLFAWLKKLPPISSLFGANKTRESTNPTHSLKLSDYHWPWVAAPFRKCLADYRPDLVVFQYVTTTYLMQYANETQQREIVWAVDLHDCLSQRCEQFTHHGQKHWLEISEAEEIAALRNLDLLIAIQAAEAEWFAQRLPARVVVAGHCPLPLPPHRKRFGTGQSESQGTLVVGFLASNNFPNRDAITQWLDEVFFNAATPPIHLVVAGTICEFLTEHLRSSAPARTPEQRIELLGPISDLTQFYEKVDLVVSPIRVGTGLKIKTIEALAFQCPVLATPHAAAELAGQNAGVIACEAAEQWQDELNRLYYNRAALAALSAQAAQFARQQLRPEIVYAQLADAIQQMLRLPTQATS